MILLSVLIVFVVSVGTGALVSRIRAIESAGVVGALESLDKYLTKVKYGFTER